MADYGIAIRPTGFVVKFVVSTEDSSGVDDDGLAGHGLGAAHGDHHVGAVVLVGRLFQERARSRACDLLGPEVSCVRSIGLVRLVAMIP